MCGVPTCDRTVPPDRTACKGSRASPEIHFERGHPIDHVGRDTDRRAGENEGPELPANEPAPPWPWMPCKNWMTDTWSSRHPRTRAPARPCLLWIRSNGSTASALTSPIRGAMANATTAPTRTGPGPPLHQPCPSALVSRPTLNPASTMPTAPAKPAAPPLVYPCGARMRIVSFITDPRVVDHILHHRDSERCKVKDPFEPRAPPEADSRSRQ